MKASIKKGILQRLTIRVSTGLSFIEFNYLANHPTPDAAWIRNIYILLSFYTELLLKAIYVYEKQYSSRVELNKILTSQRHNLERIAKDIGPTTLLKYGITEVKTLRTREYRITTDVGTFYVKDFVDIRYDFLTPRVRKLKGSEHKMFETQIKTLNRINAFLKGPAWNYARARTGEGECPASNFKV